MNKKKSKKRAKFFKAFAVVFLFGLVSNFLFVGFTKPSEAALQYDFSVEYDAVLAEDLNGIAYPDFSGDMGRVQNTALSYKESDTFAAFNETRVLVEPTCESGLLLFECDIWVLKESANFTPAIYFSYGSTYVGKVDSVSVAAYRLDETSLHFEGSVLKGTLHYSGFQHVATIFWVWCFSAILAFLFLWLYQIIFGPKDPNPGPDML